MFIIDNNFLSSIGYDTATLAAEKRQQIIDGLTEEMNVRLTERFFNEVDDAQAEEMSEIQENPDRARRWLNEFHSDYRAREDFKQVASVNTEDDAVTFYATALWLGDAIPMYGEVIQEELNKYQQELVGKRKMVNQALGL